MAFLKDDPEFRNLQHQVAELAHGVAELTAKVTAIEEKLAPWDGLAKRMLPAVEFFERLRGNL